MLFYQIAVPSFMKALLTYSTTNVDAVNFIGHRVQIPFGKNTKIGVIINLTDTCDLDIEKIKPICQILDSSPVLTSSDIVFLKRLANYYHISLNELVLQSSPKLLLSSHEALTITYLQSKNPQPQNLSKTQQNVIGLTQSPKSLHYLNAHFSSKTIQSLIKKEYLLPCPAPRLSSPTSSSALATLSPAQQKCIDHIRTTLHKPCLLWGATGSGKTEIYCHLIHDVLQKGQQALLLVPEIALTPQTILKISTRLNIPISMVHSQVSPQKRLAHWIDAQSGRAKIIVGTRSALFTSIKDLGIIIIDEEHDDSYRQTTPFFYSARDSAILKAKLLNIPVVLGTATPSLESLANAYQKTYELVMLSERKSASAPAIHLLTPPKHKVFSPEIIPIIQNALDDNQHVMLFLGRRGWSRLQCCQVCGWQARCQGCDGLLTKHSDQSLQCHRCQEKYPSIIDCPDCKQAEISSFSPGTQQVAKLAQELWPNHPCCRLDTDASASVIQKHLSALPEAPGTVIVGTQMITKGHDIPRLDTVVVLNADHSFHSLDFRSEEKLLAEISQVAGRSGRRERQGQVYIQTQHPGHPLLLAIKNHTQVEYYQSLLTTRETYRLPPYQYLSCFFLKGAQKAFDNCLHRIHIPNFEDTQTDGPIPYPQGKRKRQVCYQIIISSTSRKQRHAAFVQIQSILHNALPKTIALSWQIDSHLSP